MRNRKKSKGLTKKQKVYVEAKASGLNDAAAARVAGYSESVALHAQEKIESKPNVRAYFKRIAQATRPPEKVIQKVNELAEGKFIVTKVKKHVNAQGKQVGVATVERTETANPSVALEANRTLAEWAGYVEPRRPEIAVQLSVAQTMTDAELLTRIEELKKEQRDILAALKQ